jgi:RNase H-fold protein (predicted Holliday junction resolvase)
LTTLLSIDPGRDKCGVAVVAGNCVLHSAIVLRSQISSATVKILSDFEIDQIIIGNGTGSHSVIEDITTAAESIRVTIVDESHSSRRARDRFFKENPPKGLRRLIPHGLLTPERPYDDITAIILAEDFLSRT